MKKLNTAEIAALIFFVITLILLIITLFVWPEHINIIRTVVLFVGALCNLLYTFLVIKNNK